MEKEEKVIVADIYNLIALCPNCHYLTATYKGANKGYGRKIRKKYSNNM